MFGKDNMPSSGEMDAWEESNKHYAEAQKAIRLLEELSIAVSAAVFNSMSEQEIREQYTNLLKVVDRAEKFCDAFNKRNQTS